MTSKEDLLKRFKEERIAREKARIQMLHDLNRKKYSKNDEDTWRYFKPNTSLNTSNDKSPVKNAINKKGPIFARNVNSQMKRPRVKKYYSLHSFVENSLNVSAPVSSSSTLSEDLIPKRKSIHNTEGDHNKSIDYSPTSTMNAK